MSVVFGQAGLPRRCAPRNDCWNDEPRMIVDVFDDRFPEAKRRWTEFDAPWYPNGFEPGTVKRIKVVQKYTPRDHYCPHGANIGTDENGNYRRCEACESIADYDDDSGEV